jgi:hypothetical protein
LDEHNVRFTGLEKSSDPTRLKTLGSFEIELTLGDAPALKRRIEVRREGDGGSAN